jgi:hypothetical protein
LWILAARNRALGGDRRRYAAALRYPRRPVDLMQEMDPELDRLLMQ